MWMNWCCMFQCSGRNILSNELIAWFVSREATWSKEVDNL